MNRILKAESAIITSGNLGFNAGLSFTGSPKYFTAKTTIQRPRLSYAHLTIHG
ncbi:MAG: hypothetical protein GY880_09645 [Planctomycetaceae bacterium]|nr:hypothetical protein [Planctomycetaceae bacterium]